MEIKRTNHPDVTESNSFSTLESLSNGAASRCEDFTTLCLWHLSSAFCVQFNPHLPPPSLTVPDDNALSWNHCKIMKLVHCYLLWPNRRCQQIDPSNSVASTASGVPYMHQQKYWRGSFKNFNTFKLLKICTFWHYQRCVCVCLNQPMSSDSRGTRSMILN